MATISDMPSDGIKAVELDWFADDGDVISVTPRNQQRFEIQKDKAIEILQKAHQASRFDKQFNLLLSRLAHWINGRQSQIARCYITIHGGMLAFVVVRNEARYDEDFQDAISLLELDVANDPDLDLVQLRTLCLPNVEGDALLSFLDERLLLSYHGQRSRPHQLSKS